MTDGKIFQKQDYIYTPYFCEENIWQLCRSFISQGIDKDQLDILFLSNNKKQIVLLNQQLGSPGEVVVWDYHVILKYCPDAYTSMIFDFDTRLPFPVDWQRYQLATFPDPRQLDSDYHVMIRKIPSSEYLTQFTSDRQHMAHLPISEHPNYECIQAKVSSVSLCLKDYWEMDKEIEGDSYAYRYCYEANSYSTIVINPYQLIRRTN